MNDVEPSHFEINEDLHVSADREREDFQTRRRLRKALALAERFKHKYHLEQQVSSELARRCDELKTQRKCDLALVDQLNEEIKKLQTQLRDQLGTCSQSLPTVLPASSTIIATQKPSKNYPDLNTIEILKDCSFDDDLFEDMRRTSITVEDQEQEGEQEQPLEIKNSCKNPIGNTILSPKSSDRTPPPTAASLSSMKVAAKIKSRNSASKLFEHFLVVGASDQVNERKNEKNAFKECSLYFYLIPLAGLFIHSLTHSPTLLHVSQSQFVLLHNVSLHHLSYSLSLHFQLNCKELHLT